MFVDGIYQGHRPNGVGDDTCFAEIGANDGFWFDEMRLSSGILYPQSTNFSPPAIFTNTGTTLALFDFSEPGLVATDLSGNGNNIVWTSEPTRGPGR